MINALDAPAEAAWAGLQAAQDAAAAVPARIRLGQIAPDMVRLDTETKQITHAIRMAAYNTETALARALHGHYARAGDEAYALIREALTSSGDIIPGPGRAAHPARPAHRPPPDPGPRSALRSAQPSPCLLPRHPARPALRSQAHPCMIFTPMSGVLGPLEAAATHHATGRHPDARTSRPEPPIRCADGSQPPDHRQRADRDCALSSRTPMRVRLHTVTDSQGAGSGRGADTVPCVALSSRTRAVCGRSLRSSPSCSAPGPAAAWL